MKNNKKTDFASKIIKIHENMKHLSGWEKISDLYKILEDEFKNTDHELPTSYDTFYKQLKGHGSKKYMELYYNYLWSRNDVESYYSNLEYSKNNTKKQLILISILAILLMYITYDTIQDNLFEKLKKTQTIEYKQCMKKCLD